LKPKYYEPLSNFAFSFNLRRYNLEEHFNNPEMSDITFLVNSHGGVRGEFYAHRIAFAHASDAFHDMLDTGVLDPPVPEGQTTGRYTIEMEDMEYEAGPGRL